VSSTVFWCKDLLHRTGLNNQYLLYNSLHITRINTCEQTHTHAHAHAHTLLHFCFIHMCSSTWWK